MLLLFCLLKNTCRCTCVSNGWLKLVSRPQYPHEHRLYIKLEIKFPFLIKLLNENHLEAEVLRTKTDKCMNFCYLFRLRKCLQNSHIRHYAQAICELYPKTYRISYLKCNGCWCAILCKLRTCRIWNGDFEGIWRFLRALHLLECFRGSSICEQTKNFVLVSVATILPRYLTIPHSISVLLRNFKVSALSSVMLIKVHHFLQCLWKNYFYKKKLVVLCEGKTTFFYLRD